MRVLVPAEGIGGHLIHVPVQVGGPTPTRFILDTGIGLNLVSAGLAERLGLQATGEVHVGKRMSGQEVSVRLLELPSLSVGPCRRENLTVGMLDMDLPPEMNFIEGFLSPSFFEEVPFTICRHARWVALEDADSMAVRLRTADVVPMRVDWVGPSVSLFADLRLTDGTEISAEVDTGSDILILDARFMERLGVHPGGPGVEKREGTDETGHHFVRYSAAVQGSVSLRAAPGVAQSDPAVMFQEIIYDGLLGDRFLRAFDVTYDVAGSRLLFTSHEVDPTRD